MVHAPPPALLPELPTDGDGAERALADTYATASALLCATCTAHIGRPACPLHEIEAGMSFCAERRSGCGVSEAGW